MKITAVLKGKADTQGRKLVSIRFSEGQKRNFRSMGFRLKSVNFKKGKVVGVPNADQLNLKIRTELLKAETGTLTEPKSSNSFSEYCLKCFSGWTQERSNETLRTYRSELNKIEGFSEGVNLDQIDLQFLNNYKDYLYGLGNSRNTVWKSFKFIRTIIRKAFREKLISDNPFDQFAMVTYRDPVKTYLLREDVEKIINYDYSEDNVRKAAAWFAILCLTGLRFSDAANFDKRKNVRSGRIVIFTQKTGEVVSFPLSLKVKELLQSVDYEPLNFSNQYFNKLLKQVQELCEIEQNLVSHMGRRTFTMLLADSFVSQEVAAKLLGHRSLKTTQVYYKISPGRIDEELKKLAIGETPPGKLSV